jgi:hypothetical protein
VQLTYKAVSNSISAHSVESLNSRLATPAQAIAPVGPPLGSSAHRTARELGGQIEVRVNEGGAEGEASL